MTTTLVGTMLRSIRIVESLGEGGMGEVYVGLDERLGRRVAVKAVRRERRMDRRARARFAREARILSRLEHPNICRIYDFIEEDEVDYIVLELVQGDDLVTIARQGRSLTSLLAIAEQVARALVAAHSVSVIHRDLKPEHVLVDGDGLVKVLDFGLARATADDDAALPTPEVSRPSADAPSPEPTDGTLTELGDVVGTPRSMSPEQARGEPLTAASDIYSFGLVLQELFTGRRPYPDGLSFPELRQKAMWGETLPVTGVDSQVTELIGRLKSFEPRDRPSAVATAERLRWLRDRPRRRLRRLAVGAVAAGLVIAAAASLLGFAHARRSLAVATEAQAETEAVNDFLVTMLADATPSARGIDLKVVEVLDQAASNLEQDLAGFPLRRATVELTLGRTYQAIGEYEPARAHIETALALRRSRLGPGHPDSLSALNVLGQLQRQMGELEAAEASHREALEGRLRVLGGAHPQTLQSTSDLAVVLYHRGFYDEAEELLRSAIARLGGGAGGDEQRVGLEVRLANVLIQNGQYDEAEGLERQVYEWYRARRGEHDPATLNALNNLGVVLAQLRRFEESEAAYRQASEGRREVLGPDHPETLQSLRNHAVALRRLGRLDEAEARLRDLVNATAAALGDDHPRTAEAMRSLAVLRKQRGDLTEAESLYRRELEIERAQLGDEHEQTLSTLGNLANLLTLQERYREAEALYLKVIAGEAGALGGNHPRALRTRYNYAWMLQASGRLEAAEAGYREVAALALEARGPDDPDSLLFTTTLAAVVAERGREGEAETLLRDALERATGSLGAQHRTTVNARSALVELLRRQGRTAEADAIAAED